MKKIQRERTAEEIMERAAGLAASNATLNLSRGTVETIQGMNLFRQESLRLENVSFEQAKGNLFEYIEAAKFNRNAANAGASIRAHVTAAEGMPHDASDINLVDKGRIVTRVQAKFMKTENNGMDTSAASSTFAQAGGQNGHWGKYHGYQRLVRREDNYTVDEATGKNVSLVEKARSLAHKRGQMPGEHSEEYQDVEKNLTDRLHDDNSGVSTEGTTLEEVKQAYKDSKGYAFQIEMEQLGRETCAAAKNGAVAGGVMTAIYFSATNLWEVYQDRKKLDAAITDIGKQTAKGAARGGATGGMAAILRFVGVKSNVSILTDQTASVAAAGAVIDVGVSVYDYIAGNIDGDELAKQVGDTGVKTLTTIYMTKAIGAVIGSSGAMLPLVMYSVSSYMISATRAIMENCRLNAEEYDRAARLLREETEVIYRQKAILEEGMKRYTTARKNAMRNLLVDFDEAMWNGGDYDRAISSILIFAEETGISLQYADRNHYDRAMANRETFVLK